MDGYIKIGTKLDTKSFDKQIEDLEQELETLEQRYKEYETMEPFKGQEEDMKDLAIRIEKTKNKLIGLKHQQESLYTSSQKSYQGMSDGVEKVIKKVGKWALAVFGVRSAYMLIRRSMSTLSQEDENLSAQLQYISWTLAQTIKPIVDWIVNAVYSILQAINSITMSLFNMKLFKGPDEFAKSMKKASGSAKEIQKTLAGFDEKNVLGINVSGGGGVGDTNFTPTFNDNVLTDFIDKVKNVKKKFEQTIDDMYKSLEDPSAYKKAYGNWDWLIMGVVRMMAGLGEVFLGFFETIGGLLDILVGIFTGDWEKIGDGFYKLIDGIGKMFHGFIEFVWGRLEFLLGIIKGLFLPLVTWLWEYILKPIINFAIDVGGKTINAFSWVIGSIKGFFDSLKEKAKEVLGWIDEKTGGLITKLGQLKTKVEQSALGKAISGVTSVSSYAIPGYGTFKLASKFFGASGGIINNPGSGVPIATNTYGGERGAEGLIPLTDTQVMAQLGETIGRYVTINLTNVTELDGNTIARKVNQIQNNNNFVRNR